MSICSLESSDVVNLLSEAPFIRYGGRTFSRLQITSAAYRLSLQLPDASRILNLHTLRHEFIIVLMAIGFKGATAVLPANTAKNTLLALIHDDRDSRISVPQLPYAELANVILPEIDFLSLLDEPTLDESLLKERLTELAACEICIYTSGSTGQPKPVFKTWHSMAKMAHKAIQRFDLTHQQIMVGTVPSQHMFGLETTVFWPLFSSAILWSEKPLFAEDMMDVFQVTQQAVFLISTPLHLKNWVESQEHWPSREMMVLSATAPMEKSLAEQVTGQWHVKLFEVLGSTETASFASREMMASELWKPYQNTNLQVANGSYEVAFSDLEEFYPLQDDIQVEVGGCFKLLGRQSDMIKVAGKRASLQELNRVLLEIEGVHDGVFLNLGKERLAAAIVSDLSIKEIKSELSQSVDPVFLPRPVYFMDRLPRNELGKLQMNQLLEEIDGKYHA